MKTKDIPFDYLERKDISNVPDVRGLYALADINKNIVYIGKSDNIRKRLITHRGNKNMPFAYFIFYPYHLDSLNGYCSLLESKEQRFISKYKPIFNKQSKNAKFMRKRRVCK